jgi:uncharacterized zinc-type alcohol dehydrogenase-like protein
MCHAEGRADMTEMLTICADKNITPRVELAPISDVNNQMQRLREGKARYRIVLLSEDEWAKHKGGQ